jgi:hypothetical protein
VIQPQFIGDQKSHDSILSQLKIPADEPIPPLFKKVVYPEWIKRFYQKTGIDLALISHLNRHFVYQNEPESVSDFQSEFFPLRQGYYTLKIKGRPLCGERPPGPVSLVLSIHGKKGAATSKHEIRGDFPLSFPIEITDSMAFITIQLHALENNCRLVEEVVLVPDYRKHLNRMMGKYSN